MVHMLATLLGDEIISTTHARVKQISARASCIINDAHMLTRLPTSVPPEALALAAISLACDTLEVRMLALHSDGLGVARAILLQPPRSSSSPLHEASEAREEQSHGIVRAFEAARETLLAMHA